MQILRLPATQKQSSASQSVPAKPDQTAASRPSASARAQSAELHSLVGGQGLVGGVPGGQPKPDEFVGGVTTANTDGPAWNPHGDFKWVVRFATTDRSGWIVQKVVNTYIAKDDKNKNLGGFPTKSYYEAWAVDAAGAITHGPGGSNDWWLRPSRGDNTKGEWTQQGTLYFTTTNPATSGMTAGGVPDAGILLSSKSAPANLGSPLLSRSAGGFWDSTTTEKVHQGTAA